NIDRGVRSSAMPPGPLQKPLGPCRLYMKTAFAIANSGTSDTTQRCLSQTSLSRHDAEGERAMAYAATATQYKGVPISLQNTPAAPHPTADQTRSEASATTTPRKLTITAKSGVSCTAFATKTGQHASSITSRTGSKTLQRS